MGRIILISGGVRSGKSDLAERICTHIGGMDVTYLATALAEDDEMRSRIKKHRASRPAEWQTWEGPPEEMASHIRTLRGVMLLDCVGNWISRMMFCDTACESPDMDVWMGGHDRIIASARDMAQSVQPGATMVVVTNEVGMTLVPVNLIARRFQELMGRVNRVFAERAQSVGLIVMGLPIWLKGGVNPPY